MTQFKLRRLFCLSGLLLCLTLFLTSVPAYADADPTAGYYPTKPNAFQVSGKIWIAGDSIAADHSYENINDYARFVHGWGEVIGDYLTNDAQVFNGGISGQSAMHFIEEENYQTIMDGIGKGDLFLISFGHNDYKSNGPTHSTLGTDVEGSYKWYLKNYYIDPALKAGAMPVLCTSVVLCTFTNNTISKSQTQMQFVQAMKDLYREYLAQGIEIGLIDTNSLTRDFYNANADHADSYFAVRYDNSSHTSTSVDRVHSSLAGANAIADMIVQNLFLMYPDFARYNACPATDGGNGTAKDPYKISTWWQLAHMLQDETLNTPDTYFQLTADLEPRIQNIEGQTVLYAHLDGGGHSVKNPIGNVMRSFLDVNYGAISDLHLQYNLDYVSDVPQTTFIGQNFGTISNCTADGNVLFSYFPEDTQEFVSVGTFAAANQAGGEIRFCQNHASVEFDTNISQACIGGITGTNAGTIADCTNDGAVLLGTYKLASEKPLTNGSLFCVAGGITAITSDGSQITGCMSNLPRAHDTLSNSVRLVLNDEIETVTDTDLQTMLADAVLGDVSADYVITTADAQLILQYALQLNVPDSEETARRADVDKNGAITLSDARRVLRAALQIEPLKES